MTEAGAFGERYYGQEDLQAARRRGKQPDTEVEAQLRKLLAEDVPNRVKRAVKQWNQTVRELIRNETALRLSVLDARLAVPVKVWDGLPLPFSRVLEGIDEILLWLILNRPILEAAGSGLDLVNVRVWDLEQWLWDKEKQREQQGQAEPHRGSPPAISDKSLREAQAFLAYLLKVLQESLLVERLKQIDEDVLGAYFFWLPEIRLYWMVIGFFARYLGVQVEDLTLVVLAHELAHAYTHLGKDIDGREWDTRVFAGTDLNIVEGLAQFYTEVVCKRMADRYPEPFYAYREFLKLQGGPYHAHITWSINEERKGEVVRISLLHTRTNQIQKYSEFLQELARAQQSLGR